jgi:DNA-binding HxlR family transcriptional regulator
MHCSVAQCLEVIGEWWSMLIVRDVFLGTTGFEDFRERLGISRNILTDRLQGLVDSGVLEKVQYCEHPPRSIIGLLRKVGICGLSSRPCASGATDTPPLRVRHCG